MKTFEQRLILISLVSIALIITPFISYEPNTQPKFFILVPLSVIALFNILFRKEVYNYKKYFIPLIFIWLYVIFSLMSFIFSSQPIAKQIYGIQGRNLGLITYLCFIIFFAFSMFNSSLKLIDTALNAILISGFASAALGVAQLFGFNIYKGSNPAYGLGVGFLGNPNFQSALLGISLVICASLLFDPTKPRIFLCFQIVITLIALSGAKSTQGYAVAIIGIATVSAQKLYSKNYVKTLLIFIFTGSVLLIFSILGFLGKGPISNYLYQTSTTYRGDYWRTAWRMMIENPLIGLGFDSYRDNYRLYRDSLATNRRGPEVIADSPHNTLLDAGVNGGFGLFIINILIVIFILFIIIKYLRKTKTQDPRVIGLFAVWVAFMAQTLISLGNIALSLWGWIIGGLIVGLEINSKNLLNTDSNKKRIMLKTRTQISLGIIFGAAVSGPNFIYDTNFASAYKSGKVERIISSAKSWPGDGYKMAMVVEILINNGFNPDALNLAKTTTQKYPEVYEAWKSYYKVPGISLEEKNKIISILQKLDPQNKTLVIP
jgi:O-antigen ligase